jgi:3-oxoadipate enol-lactonase
MTTTTLDKIDPKPTIAVERAGTGPLVVFLHGIGGNRRNWLPQLPAFSRNYMAAAWDARGYGDSDDYDGALDFADFSHDLARVLDHYKVAKAHIVGLSMGGRIAQQFYFLYPDRVATLTLCDTQRGFALRSQEERDSFLKARQAPLLSGKEPRDIAPAVAKSLLGPNATADMMRQAIESMTLLHKDSYLKALAATVHHMPAGDLRNIKVRTHVVVGEHDTLTPPALSRDMAGDIPGAELTIIPNAGHLSNLENPDVFNRAVLDFLGRK